MRSQLSVVLEYSPLASPLERKNKAPTLVGATARVWCAGGTALRPENFFLERYSVLAPVPCLRLFRACARSGVPAVWTECRGAAGGDPIHRFWKSGAGSVRQSPVFPGLYTNRRVST